MALVEHPDRVLALGDRLLSGDVRVLAEQHLGREALERVELAVGQRGAHRADRLGDPRLPQRDHIGVALDQHQPPRPRRGRTREVGAVDERALVEQLRLGRVEVLGLVARRQRPRAEAEHVPLDVGEREHDPPAEAVDQARSLPPPHREPGGEQLRLGVAGAPRRGHDAVPRARREADTELAQHVLLEAALGQVGARRSRLGRLPQHAHEVRGGALEQRQQPLALAAPLGLARVLGLTLELDARPLGQQLERTREVKPLGLHREAEDIAARAAAEAVVELLDRLDAERRRALVMERAQAGHAVRPSRLELCPRAHELDEIDRVADPLARFVGVARHQPASPRGTKRSLQARIA
jgi:hypothetical protein